MNKHLKVGVIVASFAIAAPSLAHHSFAMFDRSKVDHITGTVKTFQWTQPHCYLVVTVGTPQGGTKDWLIESGGPGTLVRQDPRWNADVVKPGDKVTVEYHPLRSGDAGGDLYDLYLPGGLTIGPHAPGVK